MFVLAYTSHRSKPHVPEPPSTQYKEANGVMSNTAAMDYDPSILIVSQQAVWPKTDTIALGNFNTANTTQYSSGKDHITSNQDSNTGLQSSQYYKNHRTLINKDSPSSSTHIHCSIQGSQLPSKSSYSNLTQSADTARTSSRDESPMVVVQVTDG